jgi:hypothetical protein
MLCFQTRRLICRVSRTLEEGGEQMRYCVTVFQILCPRSALTNVINGATSAICEHQDSRIQYRPITEILEWERKCASLKVFTLYLRRMAERGTFTQPTVMLLCCFNSLSMANDSILHCACYKAVISCLFSSPSCTTVSHKPSSKFMIKSFRLHITHCPNLLPLGTFLTNTSV